MLSEVPDIKLYRSARWPLSPASVSPAVQSRGRVRLSKIGNARSHKALYFLAITAGLKID